LTEHESNVIISTTRGVVYSAHEAHNLIG